MLYCSPQIRRAELHVDARDRDRRLGLDLPPTKEPSRQLHRTATRDDPWVRQELEPVQMPMRRRKPWRTRSSLTPKTSTTRSCATKYMSVDRIDGHGLQCLAGQTWCARRDSNP